MIKVHNIKMIDVNDWDNLVINTYKRPYSFQQQDGCKSRGIVNITIPDDDIYDEEMNESIPEIVNGSKMGVKFKTWLDRNPNKPLPGKNDKDSFSLGLFYGRNFYPDVNVLANDLHSKGLIEAGDYAINIDW